MFYDVVDRPTSQSGLGSERFDNNYVNLVM